MMKRLDYASRTAGRPEGLLRSVRLPAATAAVSMGFLLLALDLGWSDEDHWTTPGESRAAAVLAALGVLASLTGGVAAWRRVLTADGGPVVVATLLAWANHFLTLTNGGFALKLLR